ncbi:Uncharacterised protein [Escherichia coli]|uniref:Uncharacterized protein n=1 Tax=Escherichia coli TaxID=562 RepID=A0A2X1LB51_ECOLX|nr:Uncharacterised protein [Escherichia coli]
MYLEQQIESLIVWQIPNTYIIEFRGKPLEQHSLGQRASRINAVCPEISRTMMW